MKLLFKSCMKNEKISKKRYHFDIYSLSLISVNLMNFWSLPVIPRKKQGIIFLISYYSIIILCDSRCLKDIKFIYMPNCYRLFSIIKSPRTERRIQSIVSALFISIEEYWSNSTLLFNSDHFAPSRNVPLIQHSRPLDVVLELAYI